jgi:hypothetical protein
MKVYVCSFEYCSASRVFLNEEDAKLWVSERLNDASYEEMEVEE